MLGVGGLRGWCRVQKASGTLPCMHDELRNTQPVIHVGSGCLCDEQPATMDGHPDAIAHREQHQTLQSEP